MPVTVPSKSERNFTPSSTGVESPESTVVGVSKSRIVACGVTEFEAADVLPVPASLVAETLNVYRAPLVSPVIVVLVELPETSTGDCAAAPSYGVTVYRVIAASPSLLGFDQLTSAEVDAGRARTSPGAAGGIGSSGVTAFDCAEAVPGPLAFTAVTVNVYVTPLVRPETVAAVLVAETVAGVCAVLPM